MPFSGRYLRGVGEVDEQLHGSLVDVADDHFRLPALRQLPGEHRPEETHAERHSRYSGGVLHPASRPERFLLPLPVPEVRAAGGQDDAVGVDLLGAHHQHHVAELPVLPQQVDDLQGLPRVLVRDVGHACGLGDALRELVGVPQGAAAGDVHSGGVLACAGDPEHEADGQQFHVNTSTVFTLPLNNSPCSALWLRFFKFCISLFIFKPSNCFTFLNVFINIIYIR